MHKLLWSSSKFILDSAILFPFLQLSYVTETSLESTALTQWKWGESQAILVLFLVCSTILRKLQMFRDKEKKPCKAKMTLLCTIKRVSPIAWILIHINREGAEWHFQEKLCTLCSFVVPFSVWQKAQMAEEEYHIQEPHEDSTTQFHFYYSQAVCEMRGRKENQEWLLFSQTNPITRENCVKILLN